MIRYVASFRRSVSFLVAALLAALVAVVLVAPIDAAAAKTTEDPAVVQAGNRLHEAKSRVLDLTVALDQIASGYEQANAHRIRLENGMEVSADRVQQAQDDVAATQEELNRRVAAAYKHPGSDLTVNAALLDAPDAASVLHRAALFRRLASGSSDDVQDAHRVTAMVADDARQEQIVAAGATASVDEWQRHADALSEALNAAKKDVVDAEDGIATARAEAQRRAEAERRAEAARQASAAFVSHTGDTPSSLPAVSGMVCPVGQPNGFIDSWGFPRSGGRTHQGVDMFAPYGTPLFAVAEGVIYRVYNNPLGGLSINLIDTKGNMYFYTHLSSASAVTGQRVRAGDTIGAVGTSGNAAGTPPHLHWQFHPGNGAPVNPYPLAYALCR